MGQSITGQYTTIAKFAIDDEKTSKTKIDVWIHNEFSEILGKIIVYEDKTGGSVKNELYFRATINRQYGNANYDFVELTPDGKLIRNLGIGVITKYTNGNCKIEMFGLKDYMVKETQDVSDFLPFVETYLIRKLTEEESLRSLGEYKKAFELSGSIYLGIEDVINPLSTTTIPVSFDLYKMSNIENQPGFIQFANKVPEVIQEAFDPFTSTLEYFPNAKKVQFIYNKTGRVYFEADLIRKIKNDRYKRKYYSLRNLEESQELKNLISNHSELAIAARKKAREDYLMSQKTSSYLVETKKALDRIYEEEKVIKSRADRHGYVYKNIGYWVHMVPSQIFSPYLDGKKYVWTVKDLLNGDFQKIGESEFNLIYNTLVVQLSKNHSEWLPANSPVQKFTETTTRSGKNIYGITLESYSYKSDYEIKVHPRFYERYIQNLNSEKSALTEYGVQNGAFNQNFTISIIDNFLTDFPPGSGGFEQLFENVIRYIQDKKSIQDAEIKLKMLAKNKNSDLYLSDDQRTVFFTCIERTAFQSNYSGCQCEENIAERSLSSEEYRQIATDPNLYSAFYYDYIKESGRCNKR